jgi:hypothetical protein
MLSSQAMCFNIFAPLAANLELASSVFRCIIPSIAAVSSIEFEYTPPKDVFEDQSKISGVDCDLLVKGTTKNGSKIIIVIETKFVEPDFSSCGFKAVCQADDAEIKKEDNDCLYWKRKRYLYWKRTWEASSLKPSVLYDKGCPFRGSLWQLWVNHTLAKTIALRQKPSSSIFAICSPENNKTLMGTTGKDKLDNFRQLLSEPDSVMHIGVNHLISVIGKTVKSPLDKKWFEQLAKRDSDI